MKMIQAGKTSTQRNKDIPECYIPRRPSLYHLPQSVSGNRHLQSPEQSQYTDFQALQKKKEKCHDFCRLQFHKFTFVTSSSVPCYPRPKKPCPSFILDSCSTFGGEKFKHKQKQRQYDELPCTHCPASVIVNTWSILFHLHFNFYTPPKLF